MSAPSDRFANEDEPTSERAASEWVSRHLERADRFAELAAATERHRLEHGCEAYASADGSLLGVLARAVGARRVLEVGTALGYSAAWLAYGAAGAQIDTIESDPAHAELAAANLRQVGVADRVRVHVGRSPTALEGLRPAYDLVLYDAYIPCPAELSAFRELLRPGGLLVTSNLFLGRYHAALPGLEHGASYRRQLFDEAHWLTTFAGLKALSIRL